MKLEYLKRQWQLILILVAIGAASWQVRDVLSTEIDRATKAAAVVAMQQAKDVFAAEIDTATAEVETRLNRRIDRETATIRKDMSEVKQNVRLILKMIVNIDRGLK